MSIFRRKAQPTEPPPAPVINIGDKVWVLDGGDLVKVAYVRGALRRGSLGLGLPYYVVQYEGETTLRSTWAGDIYPIPVTPAKDEG